MLIGLLVCVVCSLYYYVESFKSALPPKKWALAGFIFGPFVLPMFTISQHITLRHAQGFQSTFLRA
ncbi:hypothetical protein [Aliiglaciecola litoralis]|uniref:Uncharacterized protein n=1 Tax=Aliiglaciecola litoralis TaxID=582857 RepID=A0ABP3WN28_9ALTE